MTREERMAVIHRLNKALEEALDTDQPTDDILKERNRYVKSMPYLLAQMYRKDWPLVIINNSSNFVRYYTAINPDDLARHLLYILAGEISDGTMDFGNVLTVYGKPATGLVAHAISGARKAASTLPITGEPKKDLKLIENSEVLSALLDTVISDIELGNEAVQADSAIWLYAVALVLRSRASEYGHHSLCATIRKFLSVHTEVDIACTGLDALTESVELAPGDRAWAILHDFKMGSVNLRHSGRKALEFLRIECDECVSIEGSHKLSETNLNKSIENALNVINIRIEE